MGMGIAQPEFFYCEHFGAAPSGGGADGTGDLNCATAPAVNPCAPASNPSFNSVMKHDFLAFHSTVFHINRGQFLALKISRGNTAGLPLRKGTIPFCTYR